MTSYTVYLFISLFFILLLLFFNIIIIIVSLDRDMTQGRKVYNVHAWVYSVHAYILI